ncbi:hypothetical protein D3C83_225160 [compost metagenome]
MKARSKGENIRPFLFYTFIAIFDLQDFINGEVVNVELKSPASAEERENLLADTIME